MPLSLFVACQCHGWMGLEVIEPKSDSTWKNDNIMSNVNKVIEENSRCFIPGCQLLLTCVNAPCHVAKIKGSLSDDRKQPILTQMVGMMQWIQLLEL